MAAGLYDITTETLGKGHFAVVKLAKHCLTGESVAIKIIDKARLNKDGLQQLSSEIKLWSRLSEHEHPNVVKLYQVIDTRTKLYLVMEYCGRDVCDLYDHIQRRNHGNGLKEWEVKHIFKQICSAIGYCHALRIVHRDLKPENILIIAQPHEQTNLRVKYPLVKLIDFGFSNQWAEGEMLRTSCGSLAYSAPEILLGDHYDGPKVDIWGLGCILYILLYGSNPFMQINDSETLCRILDCTFTTPARPYISESVIELIKSLLKRDPNTRLTIQEIIAHPWLSSSEDLGIESAENVTKSPFIPKNVKKSVHDKVIDQMIIQGVGTSREFIERALERARGNESSHCNKSLTPNNANESKSEENVNGERIQSSIKNEHYVKATYHLLKDKMMREMNTVNTTSYGNQTANTGQFSKRLFPLKPRKHLISQISKNTRPFQEEDSEEDSASTDSNQCNSFNQLDLPSDDGNSVVLPLARKCSIVSEEGSCVADGSDISSNHDYDGPIVTHEEQCSTHSTVNIVVTDCSQDLNICEYDMQNSNDEQSVEECNADKGSNIDHTLRTTKNEHIINKINNNSTLHSVSSSPELLRNDDSDGNDYEFDNYVSHSRSRPPNMILSTNANHDKDVSDRRFISQFGANPKNTNNSLLASNSPSMRVIVQSKSYNNILFNESDTSGDANRTCDLTNAKTVCMKRHKTDRTDCCNIC